MAKHTALLLEKTSICDVLFWKALFFPTRCYFPLLSSSSSFISCHRPSPSFFFLSPGCRCLCVFLSPHSAPPSPSAAVLNPELVLLRFPTFFSFSPKPPPLLLLLLLSSSSACLSHFHKSLLLSSTVRTPFDLSLPLPLLRVFYQFFFFFFLSSNCPLCHLSPSLVPIPNTLLNAALFPGSGGVVVLGWLRK